MKQTSMLLLVIVCVLFASGQAFAVSDASVLTLLISPSPQANAMGQSYGSLWADDPASVVYNPAAAGLYAQKFYAGYSFYPDKMYWLPQYGGDLWFQNSALNLGFNLQTVSNIPVSIGFGYQAAKLNLGEQINSDEQGNIIGLVNTYEKYSTLTFSVAVEYYLRASFGYSTKLIDSKMALFIDGAEFRAQPTAHDWGLIVQAPVFDILKKMDNPVTIHPNILPFFAPGFYYSKRNIGDGVTYREGIDPDALPREAYIGMNLEAGFRYHKHDSQFDILHFRWSREMEDLLVSRDIEGNWEYLSGLNDIKFWDNVFLGKANDLAIKHQGYQIGLADVAFFRRGFYEDIEGRVVFHSRGYGVNFTQPLRILSTLLDYKYNNQLLNILLSLDVEYHESEFDFDRQTHPFMGTVYKGVSVHLRQFQL